MSTLVVITGATGGQGGSVIATLLNEKEYRLRAVTRNVHSEAAKKLIAQGVDVVAGDLDDRDSLIHAFKDANIIFGMTNFFETAFKTLDLAHAEEVEYRQGCNIASAAAATPTLRHYIWSTLPDSRELSGGNLHLEYYVGKARVDQFILETLPELFAKTTFLWLSLFAETMTHAFCQPIKLPEQASDKHIWIQPVPEHVLFPTIGDHNRNTGPFVLAAMRNPELTLPGKYVFAEVETLAQGELLAQWADLTGNSAEYINVGVATYERLWPIFGRLLAGGWKLLEDAGDGRWKSRKYITGEELGIPKGTLPGWKEGLMRYFAAKEKADGA